MHALDDRARVVVADTDRIRDTERQLLGACLWSGPHGTEGLDDAAESVGPQDFAVYAHGVVFQTMLDLRAANAPVNAATVYERLSATGRAAELGEQPGVWIAGLVELQGSDSDARYYAGVVREASRGRRLKRAVHAMSGVVTGPARPAADMLAECEQILFDAGDAGPAAGARGMADLVREALDHYDRVASGQVRPGLPTGFPDLDCLLGGLRNGQMVVIAARPSVGKTALATAIATNVTRTGAPVFFVSLEMPASEIINRVLAMRSGVPLDLILKAAADPDQVDRLVATAQKLKAEPLHLDDGAPMTAARIASVVRRAIRRHGAQLVVIDYLGLVEPENPKDNMVHRIGTIARRLKELARSCNVPVVVLCQLNRESETRPARRPLLSDLRDSGEIEQHADSVLLLSPQHESGSRGDILLVDVLVAKNRMGAKGEATLAYHGPIVRFDNYRPGD